MRSVILSTIMFIYIYHVNHAYTTGLYRLCKAKAGLMRGLLGVSGQDYYEFTTEGVLAPDTFQHLEWHCFKELFDSVERDSRFRCVLVLVIVVVVVCFAVCMVY